MTLIVYSGPPSRYGAGPYGAGPYGRSAAAPTPGFDVAPTVISQYANSPAMLALLDGFAGSLDPTADFDAFYNLVWNVDTAQGYGLDVWGRIVGVSRSLHLTAVGSYLGFTGQTGAQPLNQGVFFNENLSTTNYALSDTAFRRLIFAKALANISDGSIPAINQILINLFPTQQNAYVTDGLDMTMTYTFHGALSPVDYAIVSQSGVLPKPTGVTATIVQI